MNPQEEIFSLLKLFQEGYTRRDISELSDFMSLFLPNAEVIGTNGIKPGINEWYINREEIQNLIKEDWETWGDFQLDIDSVSIQFSENVGWVSASATVSKKIGVENYDTYLEFIKNYIETSNLSAEQKLLFILRGGTNTIYEIRRGESFVWALRFTAVVVRENNHWKFSQIHFSFPTIYFPDVRIIE